MNGVITLALVALGAALIVLGAFMSWRDWEIKHRLDRQTKGDSLEKTVGALTKLLVAMKDYPTGQRLIVFGIVVLLIAGLFGGVSGLGERAGKDRQGTASSGLSVGHNHS